MQTRRYPWGIQRLVSTHQLPHNPKVLRSVQICIWGGVCGPDQINPKCRDLSKSAFSEGGGGGCGSDQHSWNTWVGALKEFWAQILQCHTLEGLASQIVSHTLRVETNKRYQSIQDLVKGARKCYWYFADKMRPIQGQPYGLSTLSVIVTGTGTWTGTRTMITGPKVRSHQANPSPSP